jgi:hypothetical protein
MIGDDIGASGSYRQNIHLIERSISTTSATCSANREPWMRKPAPAPCAIARLEPRDADCSAKLKKRTLTNLYNERPAWLDLAHKKLDAAVAVFPSGPRTTSGSASRQAERWQAP